MGRKSMYLNLTYDECILHVKEIASTIPLERRHNHWIIFDIDQTLITDETFRHRYQHPSDAFKYQYRGIHTGIPQMISLYNWCCREGFKMCMITGRYEKLYNITLKNLTSVGITKCDRFYMRKRREDTIMYKSRCRREILDTGDIILCNIGDREEDLINESSEIDALHGIKLPSTY